LNNQLAITPYLEHMHHFL